MDTRRDPKKRISSQDVADRAGISRATVSAHLNRSKYVSPEVAERIDRAIKELNYTPDPLARALKTQDAKTIGLVIPVMTAFYMPMIEAIDVVARTNGYELLITSSNEDGKVERSLLEVFKAKRVTGVILVPCSEENAGIINDIRAFGMPLIQVNRRIETVDSDYVVSNNFEAAYQATEHLVARGRGKIVFFGYDEHNIANLQKKRGYDAAIRAHGLEAGLVIPVREHERAYITAQLENFLDSGQRFDAMIATTQGKTVIALKTLREKGYRIPADVAVIGFDDTPWSALLQPPLTVISENTHDMGRVSAELLIERMENRGPEDSKRIVLEDRLIIRDST